MGGVDQDALVVEFSKDIEKFVLLSQSSLKQGFKDLDVVLALRWRHWSSKLESWSRIWGVWMRFFMFSCHWLSISIWASWSFVDVWCLWILWRSAALSNWNLEILRWFLIIFINLICPCFWNFRKVHNLVAFKHPNGLIFFEEILRRTLASRHNLF